MGESVYIADAALENHADNMPLVRCIILLAMCRTSLQYGLDIVRVQQCMMLRGLRCLRAVRSSPENVG